ncbi:hypothetical protein ACKWTF_004813 [Chironomus riparius]
MRFSSILCATLLISCIASVSYCFEEDNEFADFEFEEDQLEIKVEQRQNEPQKVEKVVVDENTESFNDIDDGIVEDEFDQDEFEGFGGDVDMEENKNFNSKKQVEPKLNIVNKIPYNRVLWHNYWIELLFICGLVVYFINYTMGKNKNIKIANAWLLSHRSFLEDNFALVGDDTKKDESTPGFIKESDSIYSLWCSGRTLVEGMLVELKLIKRQDLLSITMGHLLFGKKNADQVQIKVELSKDSMDTFVMAICSKKSASRLFKELTDLKQFCVSVAKSEDKYNLPNGFSVLSEIAEATSAVIDSRLLAILSKYSNSIESIHISDQYSGLAIQDQDTQQAVKPEMKKMLIITYTFTDKTDMEELKPIMQLVIYLIEKLKRYKLSREGKLKADKNRQRVEEEFLKNTHQTRMEAAALKKEERRKADKEKLMNEDNVEKQLRMEKKMKRKDAKKSMPKMKSMNIHL